MALALEARAMKDDMMLGNTPKAAKRRRRLKDVKTKGRLWKHATLSDIDGLLSPDQIAGMFCFTLIRNPWDRMVSYYHWLKLQTFDHPAVTLATALDFDGFARHPQTLASLRAAPARRYMTDAEGTERCDAYLRLEHLADDAQALHGHLGFDLEMGRANASPRDRDWRPYYSADAAAAIADACSEDISRFEYRFDP